MADRWSEFMTKATKVSLQYVLSRLNLQISGKKDALKLRIQEAVRSLNDQQLLDLIPVEGQGAHGGGNIEEDEDVNNSCESDNDEFFNANITGNENNNPNNQENLDAELLKLRKLVKKKEEISKLKKKLRELELENVEVMTKSACYTFKDIEDSIPTFSGDNNLCINRWITLFEESAEIMQLDGKTKFIFGKRLLTDTARLFVRTINVKTWSELKKELKNEFEKKVTKADIHNELRRRRKHRDENMQQYVLAMQEIASMSSIEDDDLMHYIINGIQDSESNKILLYHANNMTELKQALRKYEKFKINSKVNFPIFKKADSSEETKPPRPSNKFKCFKCRESGHLTRNCPRKRNTTYNANSTTTKLPDAENVMMLCKPPTQRTLSSDDYENETANVNHQRLNLSINYTNNFEYHVKYSFYKGGDESVTTLLTLLDSGSPVSFVQEKFVPPYIMTSPQTANECFTGINGSPLIVVGVVNTKVAFDNNNIDLKLYVVKNDTMRYSIILGRDFIEKNHMILQKRRSDLVIENNENVNKKNCDEPIIYAPGQSADSEFQNDKEDFCQQIMNIQVSEITYEKHLNMNEKLSFSVKKEIKSLVRQALEPNDTPSVGLNDNFEMYIKLTNTKPFFCAPRRLPHYHKVELQKILDDLLSRGIIRESNSPFASPIVLVKKKCGELRLCVDYRELNKITERDNYPLPLIEDHLDTLRDKRYFTTLDLRNGFHHVKIADESIKYTSFITPLGQYEYTRMPFGLKNAPSVFERFMKRIFGNLLRSGKILSFIDDLMIATETIEENIAILKEVVEIIRANHLQLRLDKCSFLKDETIYLGYRINSCGIIPSEGHLQAIKDFPTPSSVKDVHSFLGLCSYFRKFIKNFAVIAKPLYDLIRKDVLFVFGAREYETFQLLKSKLVESPVLSIFNPNAETELHCDASSVGFGAVLLQRQHDGKFHPIFYFSKRATDVESRYHSFELETLAIVYALRRFRIYLIGLDFTIVTDCQSLSLTLNKKTLNPRISRWALEIQEFSFRIVHRSGEKMQHADALSRAVNILNVDESFEFILAASQRQDPKIVKIASELEKSESSQYDMIDGLIYRKTNGKVLFYVPHHMEVQVMRTHHEALGHMGVEKCHEFLSRIYWFPNLKEKLRSYIKSCLKCLYFSPESGKTEGTLHNIPKGTLPFDTVHVDHLGPLAYSKTKKQHIFLVVDAFTKFIKLYPVKTTQSKEAISCLKAYFQNYSRPSRIVSDRGTCFTSKEFSNFLKENDVIHVKVASQCPQGNGQVERMNRVLIPMLSKLCDPQTTSDWDKHLTKIEYSMNNTVNRTTGFTPSTLLFGINQKGELCDRVLEFLQTKLNVSRKDFECIRKQACLNIAKCQTYNKLHYDKAHKHPMQYKKGDYVMLKNFSYVPGVNKKLFAKFRGPYEVEEVLSNDRYIVKDIEGLQLTRVPYRGVCAPCNMRLFFTNIDA